MSKTVRPKKNQRVLVEWVDITSQAHGNFADAGLERFTTIGFWQGYKTTPEYGRFLVIADSIDGKGEAYGVTSIPVGCVKSIRKLR